MIEDLGVANSPAQVGFYSGIVDSIFSFAQLFTIYAFGKLSGKSDLRVYLSNFALTLE
jgi:hypothetical protein